MSAVLGLYLLYPLNEVDLSKPQVHDTSVYTPEKELSQTEYGKKLTHLLELSHSDPLFASKELNKLPKLSAALWMVRLRSIQRANKALLAQSTTCELTGLYNRRYLEQLLADPMPFNDTSFGISLAILDLDYFKQVNDTYGHDVGDQVLVEVARRIQQHLFPNEYVSLGRRRVCFTAVGSARP